MILGVGTDIIEIARIKTAIERQGERFLQKLFTDNERKYCEQFNERYLRYAGRFAAKEAILKAAGTGLSGEISWHDIEILNNAAGQPLVSLSGHLNELLQGTKLHVSISHCKDYATALAVIERA